MNGSPLKGTYIGTETPMSDGFKSNAIYFKLGFLDKNTVALGRQLKELIPLLWMKAGAIGPMPEISEEDYKGMLIFPENKFAVLIEERSFYEFSQKLESCPDMKAIYIITDSERAYRDMISRLKAENFYQLYRDYLDNFRINAEKQRAPRRFNSMRFNAGRAE